MELKCKIYYCYKATNDINGKVYVGFASDPQMRWREHKRDAEKGRGYSFHAAIRKHGWEHFHFEVICCGKDKRSMLEVVEPALIEQHCSHVDKNGYNILRQPMMAICGNNGGKKGHIVTPETRIKISVARKGRHPSKETGMKISAAKKGCRASDETRQKMSAAAKGHIVTQETRLKIGAGNRGLVRTVELRNQISESLTGRTQSEESKRKRGAALKGHVVTEETRMKIGVGNKGKNRIEAGKKISAAKKGKPWSQKRRACYERTYGRIEL